MTTDEVLVMLNNGISGKSDIPDKELLEIAVQTIGRLQITANNYHKALENYGNAMIREMQR